MSDLASGFQSLPVEYQEVILLAQEQYHITVTPLQILTGGWSGAIIYLVSVAFQEPARVEHFVLKLDRKSEKARADEIQRHQDAARLSPPDFASRHMAQMLFERVEQAGAIAIFYTIAGQSLHQFRPLSAFESQQPARNLVRRDLPSLADRLERGPHIPTGVHPQQLLEQWLAFRIKPGALRRYLPGNCLPGAAGYARVPAAGQHLAQPAGVRAQPQIGGERPGRWMR